MKRGKRALCWMSEGPSGEILIERLPGAGDVSIADLAEIGLAIGLEFRPHFVPSSELMSASVDEGE